MSKTRAENRKIAEQAGFALVENRQARDVFRRELNAPNTRTGKLAHAMGWRLAEEVVVEYNSAGHVAGVRLHTPADQGAISGAFVSYSARKNFHDKGKRQAVLDYLRETSRFYDPLV